MEADVWCDKHCRRLKFVDDMTLNTPPVINAKARYCRKLQFLPQLKGPRWNIAIVFGVEKLEWWVYHVVRKVSENYVYTHFDTIHERNGQTDGQTPADCMGRILLARLHSVGRDKQTVVQMSRSNEYVNYVHYHLVCCFVT